jgi:hypothetical protein
MNGKVSTSNGKSHHYTPEQALAVMHDASTAIPMVEAVIRDQDLDVDITAASDLRTKKKQVIAALEAKIKGKKNSTTKSTEVMPLSENAEVGEKLETLEAEAGGIEGAVTALAEQQGQELDDAQTLADKIAEVNSRKEQALWTVVGQVAGYQAARSQIDTNAAVQATVGNGKENAQSAFLTGISRITDARFLREAPQGGAITEGTPEEDRGKTT